MYPNDTIKTPIYKQCSQCKERKPANAKYFHGDKSKVDGLYPRCKECRHRASIANRQERFEYNRQYNARNKERIKKQQREYYYANKGKISENSRKYRQKNKEKLDEYMREYREANPEKIRTGQKIWKKSNRDKLREYDRQWTAKNGDKKRAIKARRNARKRALPATFTADDWNNALSYFNGLCAVCDDPVASLFAAAHGDHWIPLSADNCPGTVPTNMLPLCASCNLSKSASDPVEWLNLQFSKKQAEAILERIETYFQSLKK